MFYVANQSESDPFPLLPKGEVHLWTISQEVSIEQIDRIKTVLSPEEKKRASFFKFDRLQHNYIVSQSVLRLLLSSYLRIDPRDVMLGIHKKGKPFLINDVSLYFNISNSDGVCVYAFTRDSEVGIDIERIRDLPDLDLLIEKNLTPGEKKFFQKDPANKLNRFFEFWTYKESYLKAIGEGLRLTPENLEFSIENGNIRLISNNYGIDTSAWNFLGFERDDNFTGTLTYTGKKTIIRERDIVLKK